MKLLRPTHPWATTNMTRRYGRAMRGQRLVAAVPHGHWKTSTFIAGLRTDGLSAPMVVDGAVNGDIFLAYVEQVLAPTLTVGDIVADSDDLARVYRFDLAQDSEMISPTIPI